MPYFQAYVTTYCTEGIKLKIGIYFLTYLEC